jgi:hypothetical protein
VNSIVKPLNVTALFPYTLSFFTVFVYKGALSMLFSVLPLTFIHPIVLPVEDTLTFALIEFKLTNVGLAILPFEMALPVHFVLKPLAYVGFTIRP